MANPKAKLEDVDEDNEEELDRLKFLVISLNGNSDRLFINKEIDKMIAGGTSQMQAVIDKYESGLNREVIHICRTCSTQNKTDVPLEAEFFRRSL